MFHPVFALVPATAPSPTAHNQHDTTAAPAPQFDRTASPTAPNATHTFVTLAALAATTTMLIAAPLGNRSARRSSDEVDGSSSPSTCPSVTSSLVGSTVSAITATNARVAPSQNKKILQIMTNATDTKITYEYTTQTPPPPQTTRCDVNDDATGQHSGGLHVMHDCFLLKFRMFVFLQFSVGPIYCLKYYDLRALFVGSVRIFIS